MCEKKGRVSLNMRTANSHLIKHPQSHAEKELGESYAPFSRRGALRFKVTSDIFYGMDERNKH